MWHISLCLAMCIGSAVAARSTVLLTGEYSFEYSFERFKHDFGRTYLNGTDEHRLREAIFRQRVKQILAHNAKNSSWMMGVNHLTDLTAEEFDAQNGYKPSLRVNSRSSSMIELEPSGTACLSQESSCAGKDSACCSGLICGTQGHCVQIEKKDEFDWTPHLSTAHSILEQGRCGSCWAVAATAALQFHAEIVSQNKFSSVLSPQSIMSCAPNVHECGGQGGCRGATAELAFAWVLSLGSNRGVLTIEQQPYLAQEDCQESKPSFLQSHVSQGVGVSLLGWKTIEPNSAQAMMDTLVNVGPAVASIAANCMQSYARGIIKNEDCDKIVNHAVVMMGYGHDKSTGMSYWKLRNSWGEHWGENGFFRVQRFANHEQEPCAWDTNPSAGVVCKDAEGKYPEKQWVCGSAGILIDTAIPLGTKVPEAFMKSSIHTHVDQENSGTQTGAGLVKDGAWCATQCQHFAFQELTRTFRDVDFGSDVASCTAACDRIDSMK